MHLPSLSLSLSLLPLSLLCLLSLPTSTSSSTTTTSLPHTSNWAVLVSTSRFWFNYRHLANVLSLYRTVKRLGIPDSQIILMLPDDMACNPRNAFPGTVFNNADRALDLYGDNIEVDYRGYEVTVESFIRLLTDRLPAEVPRSKRLGTDAGSNVLVYMTGHGGNEFLKFQDSEEIGSWDLADAFEQMWEKRRYREVLFMIDTCQANTLYSKFYSPNIIATGSSEIDQSSYSHHADNDVGVAVIDRWTYYNLEFLEGVKVGGNDRAATLGDLFGSYDEAKIHSKPGVRWDLFPGGEERGRERLVMDFFGNVQDVEVDERGAWDEEGWMEDLRRLREMVERSNETVSRERRIETVTRQKNTRDAPVISNAPLSKKARQGPAKVEAAGGWSQQVMGAWALLACALLWGGTSFLDSASPG
ncbi:MAG: hypothetical protein Q9219_005442 [cf. Caloplaca sp. 3 TL-2023]